MSFLKSMFGFGVSEGVAAQSVSPAERCYDSLQKVVLVGDAQAGKSSLLTRFTRDEFCRQTKSTIGCDFGCRTLQLAGNQLCKLQVWDTSGQERYRSISTAYYRGAAGFLLCLQMDRSDALDSLTHWLEEIRIQGSEGAPVIVVGCKCDLPQKVSQAQIRDFAERHGCLYIITSSKDDVNVFETFATIARAAAGLSAESIALPAADRVMAPQTAEEELSKKTNVCAVDLSKLKDEHPYVTGDPIRCVGCGAMLNCHSTVAKGSAKAAPAESYSKLEPAPQLHSTIPRGRLDGDKIWDCEFCMFRNRLNISDEELADLQAKELSDFLIQGPRGLQEHSHTVFVVDVSGSMSSSIQVPSHKIPAAIKDKRRAIFGEFMQAGDQQFQHVSYVSRLEMIQTALFDQIEQLFAEDPQARVSLIAFSDEVRVNDEKVVAGDLLSKFDGLDAVEFSAKSDKEAVLASILNLTEGGQTALGPALQIAINSAGMGGNVCLCTDGTANKGIGRLDDLAVLEDSRQFYIELGERSRVAGVTVSIMSFADEDCSLLDLMTVVEQSRGTLTRLKHDSVLAQMQNFRKPLVASTVLAMACLHRSLHFSGEADDELEQRNWLVKDCGTTHEGDSVSFSYGFRSKEEFDLTGVSNVPFQVQLLFQRPDGSLVLRVTTSLMHLTNEKGKGAQKLNLNVVATQAVQRIGRLIRSGKLDQAEKDLKATRTLLRKNGVRNDKLQLFDECEVVLLKMRQRRNNGNNNNNNRSNVFGDAFADDELTEQSCKLMNETITLV